MLQKIESGAGIKAVLLIDGKPETFGLAIFERAGFSGPQKEYGYINETGTRYVKSIYTGGSTGFGASAYDIREITEDFSREYRFVTSHLPQIIEMATAEEAEEKKRREEFLAKQEAKVSAINTFPITFDTGNEYLDKFLEFRRSEAVYNPKLSSKISGGGISLIKKGDQDIFYRRIELENYKTRDGKLRTTEFMKDLSLITKQDSLLVVDDQKKAKVLLQALFTQKANIEKMINNADKIVAEVSETLKAANG